MTESEICETVKLENCKTQYFIDIPPYWTKDDLLDLKDHLGTLEVGLVPVWIRVSGIEKNTKFTIEDTEKLAEWVKIKNV